MNNQVSHEEIAEYAEGLADRATARRVLHAALTDISVSERLSALEAHDSEYERSGGPGLAPAGSASPAENAADDRARRLWASMRNATLAVAAEAPTARAAPEPAPTQQILASVVERVLQIGRHLLTLPCLAPATAAAAPDANIHRQTVQTSDGVRIEFQQLPGASPFRLRVFVDASQIQQTGGGSAANYDVAYLTLEDGGSGESARQIPDRHVLIVSLNEQGRGFADFVIGGEGAERNLPAPAGACRLVSATLAHRSPG